RSTVSKTSSPTFADTRSPLAAHQSDVRQRYARGLRCASHGCANFGPRVCGRFRPLLASDEVVLERERAGFGPRGHTELGEDVLQVPAHGVLADYKLLGDLSIASSRRDQTQDLELPRRQSVRVGASGRRLGRLEPDEVQGGA